VGDPACMEAIHHSERLTLDELYDGYVRACSELRVIPLPPDDLLALLHALAERDTAILH
jgi:hypothetical protein